MKVFISTFILCSTLSVLAGEAVAGEVVHLNCEKGECQFSEELGPDQTHEYRGTCSGEKSKDDYSMACHPVKSTTCTGPLWSPFGYYYSCTCTNWSPTERKNVTIDILCND